MIVHCLIVWEWCQSSWKQHQDSQRTVEKVNVWKNWLINSDPWVFCKKAIMESFTEFTGKHLWLTPSVAFSCEFYKIAASSNVYIRPQIRLIKCQSCHYIETFIYKGLYKTFWGTTKKCENKNFNLIFISTQLSEMHGTLRVKIQF